MFKTHAMVLSLCDTGNVIFVLNLLLSLFILLQLLPADPETVVSVHWLHGMY